VKKEGCVKNLGRRIYTGFDECKRFCGVGDNLKFGGRNGGSKREGRENADSAPVVVR